MSNSNTVQKLPKITRHKVGLNNSPDYFHRRLPVSAITRRILKTIPMYDDRPRDTKVRHKDAVNCIANLSIETYTPDIVTQLKKDKPDDYSKWSQVNVHIHKVNLHSLELIANEVGTINSTWVLSQLVSIYVNNNNDFDFK